jgi:hypothetical protein
MEGALEKIKMLRPRSSRTSVEATMRIKTLWRESLTGAISSSIITVGGLCQAKYL